MLLVKFVNLIQLQIALFTVMTDSHAKNVKWVISIKILPDHASNAIFRNAHHVKGDNTPLENTLLVLNAKRTLLLLKNLFLLHLSQKEIEPCHEWYAKIFFSHLDVKWQT